MTAVLVMLGVFAAAAYGFGFFNNQKPAPVPPKKPGLSGGTVPGGYDPSSRDYCVGKCRIAYEQCLNRGITTECLPEFDRCVSFCPAVPLPPPGYTPPGYVPPGYVPTVPPIQPPPGYVPPGYVPPGYVAPAPKPELPPGYTKGATPNKKK